MNVEEVLSLTPVVGVILCLFLYLNFDARIQSLYMNLCGVMEFNKNIVFEDAFIFSCRIFLHGGTKRTCMEIKMKKTKLSSCPSSEVVGRRVNSTPFRY